MSPAQAAVLLVAVAFLVYKFWFASSGGSSYGESSHGGSSYGGSSYGGSSYGGSSYGSSRRRASSHNDYDYGGGYSGMGAGWDISFVISALMLATMVWQLGGGRGGQGWSLGEFIRRVQNMDFFQMMMFANLI
eukprot:1974129-Prymnesium_polylepis.1